MPATRPLAERFWEKVHKTRGCWLWTAATVRGYGVLGGERGSGRNVLAHRLSWEIHYGPIPPDLDVLHVCDNPPCVRPDHLFLGNAAANLADALYKGRVPTGARSFPARHPERLARGEANGAAVLTDEIVREIRDRRRSGESYSVIGARFHITAMHAWNVVQRKIWRHVR